MIRNNMKKIKKFFITIFTSHILVLMAASSGFGEDRCLEFGVEYFKNTIKS